MSYIITKIEKYPGRSTKKYLISFDIRSHQSNGPRWSYIKSHAKRTEDLNKARSLAQLHQGNIEEVVP